MAGIAELVINRVSAYAQTAVDSGPRFGFGYDLGVESDGLAGVLGQQVGGYMQTTVDKARYAVALSGGKPGGIFADHNRLRERFDVAGRRGYPGGDAITYVSTLGDRAIFAQSPIFGEFGSMMLSVKVGKTPAQIAPSIRLIHIAGHLNPEFDNFNEPIHDKLKMEMFFPYPKLLQPHPDSPLRVGLTVTVPGKPGHLGFEDRRRYGTDYQPGRWNILTGIPRPEFEGFHAEMTRLMIDLANSRNSWVRGVPDFK